MRPEAVALFVVYHVECERYDRTVCTGLPAEDGSGTLPANAVERGLIMSHANALAEAMAERAQRLGVPMAQLVDAEQYVNLMPYPQIEANYHKCVAKIGGSLDPTFGGK